ncbi:Ovarian cancer-associated protein 2, partial [Nowakowskiella sp. JEL0078]
MKDTSMCGKSKGHLKGAAMAALLCGELLNDETSADPRFVMMFSGFRSTDKQHDSVLSDVNKIQVPSLHVFGKADQWVLPERSLGLLECFDENTRELVEHERGHLVPTDAEQRIKIKEFIGKFL